MEKKVRELRDVHIFVKPETLEGFKRLCLHKGDLSYHLNLALCRYLDETVRTDDREKEDKELMERVEV